MRSLLQPRTLTEACFRQLEELMDNLTMGQASLQLFYACVGDVRAEAVDMFESCQSFEMAQGGVTDLGSRKPYQFEVLHPLQISDVRIVHLRVGEKQLPQSRQILDVHQARARDSGPRQIEFLQVPKPSQMNQVGIRDFSLAEIDADDSHLIVKRDPCAKFLEVVHLLRGSRIVGESWSHEEQQDEDGAHDRFSKSHRFLNGWKLIAGHFKRVAECPTE